MKFNIRPFVSTEVSSKNGRQAVDRWRLKATKTDLRIAARVKKLRASAAALELDTPAVPCWYEPPPVVETVERGVNVKALREAKSGTLKRAGRKKAAA